jgi:hypothetical protein
VIGGLFYLNLLRNVTKAKRKIITHLPVISEQGNDARHREIQLF